MEDDSKPNSDQGKPEFPEFRGERRSFRRTNILLGERQTSLFSRLAAKSIDALVLVVVYLLGHTISITLGVFLAATFSAFQDGLGAGQSIGKRIMGLRVIDDISGVSCSFRNSFLRNFPITLAIFFASLPILWGLLILLILPVFALELYLLLTLDTGVRLGDVLGNTLVVEYLEDPFDVMQ